MTREMVKTGIFVLGIMMCGSLAFGDDLDPDVVQSVSATSCANTWCVAQFAGVTDPNTGVSTLEDVLTSTTVDTGWDEVGGLAVAIGCSTLKKFREAHTTAITACLYTAFPRPDNARLKTLVFLQRRRTPCQADHRRPVLPPISRRQRGLRGTRLTTPPMPQRRPWVQP